MSPEQNVGSDPRGIALKAIDQTAQDRPASKPAEWRSSPYRWGLAPGISSPIRAFRDEESNELEVGGVCLTGAAYSVFGGVVQLHGAVPGGPTIQITALGNQW